ncbi:MAG: TonB-dependent receptor [Gemmatimonadaceae bacterium]|nr:TonB-dependent receptor [Gemmatimonadaceae bacterium]
MRRARWARRLTHSCVLAIACGASTTLSAQSSRDTVGVARDSARTLEGVTVRAIRAGDAPISASTITQGQIEERQQGQDLPLLLQGTPSLTIKSETGTNWGYSYVRLRGMEHRRLNFTLDGIPLNDPEDHVLYFADFPDLTNSLRSVQVQRGVGTSSAGVAAYAGSVNMESISLATEPRALDVQLQSGSFASRRGSAEYSSGLLPNRLAFYVRGSALSTDGYRRHAGIDGRSVFLSGGWFGDRDVVKATFTAGTFSDTLSYTGASVAQLAADRRFNPLNPAERDRFAERLASLAYTHAFGSSSSLATTLYRISASGDYDVCIDRCDVATPALWDFALDFAWYGVTSAWNWEGKGVRVSAGGNANTYARDHYAFARPDLSTTLYRNTGHKGDVSGFVKSAWDLGALTLFGDVQLRHATFRYQPSVNAGVASSSIDWTFVNPTAGLTYRLTPALSAYASYGAHTREPGREDMFAGFDDLDTSNVRFIGPLGTVKPERARDMEAGVRARSARSSVSANLFDMRFDNEILPIGVLSYIGTPLRKNVASSYRRGAELEATVEATDRLALSGNMTVMTSRISEFADRKGVVYRDTPALLTPTFMSAQRAAWRPSDLFSLTVEGRYAGQSNLTNTNDAALVLPSTYVVDASASVKRGRVRVALFGNNLGNSRGYSTGNVSSSGKARFFVLAPVNGQVVVQLIY